MEINMTENVWNIDELIALTDEVQNGETEYNGKNFDFQYCELTEGEEPKLKFPGSGASEEDQNEAYKEIGQARILAMILKANKKNPEGTTVTEENWPKLPSTVRWGISNYILGSADGASFRELDDSST
jgi:hypothetical protein